MAKSAGKFIRFTKPPKMLTYRSNAFPASVIIGYTINSSYDIADGTRPASQIEQNDETNAKTPEIPGKDKG